MSLSPSTFLLFVCVWTALWLVALVVTPPILRFLLLELARRRLPASAPERIKAGFAAAFRVPRRDLTVYLLAFFLGRAVFISVPERFEGMLILLEGLALLWGTYLAFFSHYRLDRTVRDVDWPLRDYARVVFLLKFGQIYFTTPALLMALPALLLEPGPGRVAAGLAGALAGFLAGGAWLNDILLRQSRPAADASLDEWWRQTAARHGVKVSPPRIITGLDGGRIANAVAWSFFGTNHVFMTADLVKLLSVEETRAILLHELGHLRPNRWGLNHVQIRTLLAFGAIAAALVLLMLYSDPAAHFTLGGLATLVFFLLLLSSNRPRLFQRQEREADAFALKESGSPDDHRGALEKLHEYSRIPREWDPAYGKQMSHPDLSERMKAAD